MRALAIVALLAGAARADDFVDVAKVIPDAVIDMRYATKDNFTGVVLYPVARCKLRAKVAERLAAAAKALRPLRLVLWDCYRPSSIQKVLWKKVPDPRYVADPAKGSVHSRGAAVDVGLADADGKLVKLPTAFDDFTEKARVREPRLDKAMLGAGFVALPTEWWHFDAPDRYPLSDEPL